MYFTESSTMVISKYLRLYFTLCILIVQGALLGRLIGEGWGTMLHVDLNKLQFPLSLVMQSSCRFLRTSKLK